MLKTCWQKKTLGNFLVSVEKLLVLLMNIGRHGTFLWNILSLSLKMQFVYLWGASGLSPMSLATSIPLLWAMAFDSSLTRAANSVVVALVFAVICKKSEMVVKS